MKQISGFSVIGINNGLRLTYTYDELNENGELVSQNNRKSLYIIDTGMKAHAESILASLDAKENGEK